MNREELLSDPSVLGGCVYYSQNREDMILQSFFQDVNKGYYVDVGAYHPDIDSVTKLFYLQGWKGINIEPQTDLHKLFVKNRKRDLNLNIGISDKKGSLTLRTYKSGGLSTVSDEVKKDYEVVPDSDTSEYSDSIIKVDTLRDVLAKAKLPHIHFLKVDVEGFEFEVLNGNDWKKFRPEIICVEANHVKHDWRPILKSNGYEKVFDDHMNEYYADKSTDRKTKFNFIKDVINDRGGGIRANNFNRLTTLYSYGRDKAHHVDELVRKIERLDQQIVDYRVKNDSIRYTGKRFASLLWRKVKSSR